MGLVTIDLATLIAGGVVFVGFSMLLHAFVYRLGYNAGYRAGVNYMHTRKTGEIVKMPRAAPRPPPPRKPPPYSKGN